MRALVLGHNGMLGSEVTRYLTEQGVAVATLVPHEARCNLRDPGPFIANVQYAIDGWDVHDAVINCIGAIPQRRAPDVMPFVNGVLPHLLAMAVRGASDAALVHPSTDCVFTGARPIGLYAENETPDATDPYGTSKAIGDLISPQPNVLVLRTSIVGVDGGLLAWVLAQPSGTRALGFTGYTWNGVTTREWARVALLALARRDRGLHHVASLTPLTKCELLKIALKTWGRGDVIVADKDTAHTDRSLRALGDYVRAPIEEQLIELRAAAPASEAA